jgi:hypothetical protein
MAFLILKLEKEKSKKYEEKMNFLKTISLLHNLLYGVIKERALIFIFILLKILLIKQIEINYLKPEFFNLFKYVQDPCCDRFNRNF